MKRSHFVLFILSALCLSTSCTNQGVSKTSSGLLYKIVPLGTGPNIKVGDFVKINFVQRLRDSVLFNSDSVIPAYVRVDSVRPTYSFTEILPKLRKGDSAVVILLADSIQRKSGQPLPPFIKKRDKLVLNMKILDIFPSMDLANADRTQVLAKKNEQESHAIEAYLTANQIKTVKTAKGTYVKIDSVGDGPQVDSGKQVFIRYTGRFFPGGNVFESNMTGPGNEPLKFVVGQRQIIQGWDDGLRLFKKGGKGTLYIPAYLAYDASPSGPSRKPFENLIFDVQVVDVTDAPKKPAAPIPINTLKKPVQNPPAPPAKK